MDRTDWEQRCPRNRLMIGVLRLDHVSCYGRVSVFHRELGLRWLPHIHPGIDQEVDAIATPHGRLRRCRATHREVKAITHVLVHRQLSNSHDRSAPRTLQPLLCVVVELYRAGLWLSTWRVM
jgi:hypothetical protein